MVFIEVDGNADTELKISVGGSMYPGGAGLASEATVRLGDAFRVPLFATGRYFDVQVENTAAGNRTPWRIASMRIEYQERGRF